MTRFAGKKKRATPGDDLTLWLAGLGISLLLLGVSAVLRGSAPAPDYSTIHPTAETQQVPDSEPDSAAGRRTGRQQDGSRIVPGAESH